MVLGSMRTDVTLFSTANTTPCSVFMPTAVEPSWRGGRGREEGEGERRGGKEREG